MRALRFLLRFVGWLLTPLVAWAASLCGAWIGAQAAGLVDGATPAAALTISGGVGFAVAGVLVWLRILRRSPELREVLAVTSEGVPVAAIEETGAEESNDDRRDQGPAAP